MSPAACILLNEILRAVSRWWSSQSDPVKAWSVVRIESGGMEDGAEDGGVDDAAKYQPPGRNEFVRSFATGLKILECFSAADPRLTLAEVARRAGVSRATARRMLLTLVEQGYAYTDDRFFELTPRVLSLGHGYWSGRGWQQLLDPSLRSLSEKLNESCSAAILVDDDVLYVSRVHTRRIMRIDLGLGTRLPAFATSMGRVLLAQYPDAELEQRLQSMQLPAFTDRTVTDPDLLQQVIRDAGEAGFALVDQELEKGLRSAAIAVKNSAGRTVLAINTSMTASAETAAEAEQRVRPALQECGADVEALVRSLGDDLRSLTAAMR